MRIYLLLTISILLAISCDNPGTQSLSEKESPKALDDNSASYEYISKRGYDDLIEGLYSELADKTPALKALETAVDKLAVSKSDSLELFTNYHGKNQRYYRSAEEHLGQMKDTVLKEKMKRLIEASLTKYDQSVSKHTTIINAIDKKNITLNDLHLILKITKTLPVIENYQSRNLPSTRPIEGYSTQLDKTIFYADSLTKK